MNNLAHSIMKDLAGKSCSVEAHEMQRPYMSFLQMSAAPSVLVDAPHFFSSQLDVPDFAIAYFGQDEYAGLTSADCRQVNSLSDLQYELDEMKDATAPKLIIAELAHLGLDRPAALQMIADYLEDGDMWDEQALISVEPATSWGVPSAEQATGRAEGRIFRQGYTAEVHTMNIVDQL
ncbi:hypothetical protein MPK64_gp219 [Erwinia phage pEa_SNUABM_16]|uniref:Uncharacterized protein n=1 Tax=Erwinia phage pEa_SNUABM_16 TaxID=2869544 RepID=A0AAE9BV25_9CAUD|nr:hypothetical protein MPK64_gp219 [Erwinia phage pEa_SNUABM_16]QZE59122.1 hypothetical protein pEaSNUABM18_00219 [Erwinia phage pEa_SNUABM_18]UAW96363.1 hypothetical protein pEaSNUABM16_00219 [Erwinia phage pEa_SNUABM_16]